jgi:hypothetical protein
MVQSELFDRQVTRKLSRVEYLLAIAEKAGYDITSAEGVCEPGYDDGPVVFANWNAKTRYNRETNSHKTLDDTMPRLAKLFEKLGFAVEWYDEWYTCEDCGKAFRTSPDGYGWTPHYSFIGECPLVCLDCIVDNPGEYLEECLNNPEKAVLPSIDLEENGFRKLEGEYANGFHPGQTDNPRDIAKQLERDGYRDYVFRISDVGQFDVHFEVWVKEDSNRILPDGWEVFHCPDDYALECDEEGTKYTKGFYWWSCSPGCLPDGDPSGPFDSEQEAVSDCIGDN